MDKEYLLGTAEKIQQPSSETAAEYEEKRELLAMAITAQMQERTDILQLVGNNNLSMMEDNHRNHARFMSSVFHHYEPVVLVETVLWVYRAYRSHGFQLTYWPAQLDQWVMVCKANLTEKAFREIYPFYHWMIIHQPVFVAESDKLVHEAGNEPVH